MVKPVGGRRTLATGRRERATRMLRITIAETATEQRWTLEGRLVQPWVGELRTCWKKRHRAQNGRGCTVDLSEVTFIDNSGLRLLRIMSKEGTHFIATGIYTKHVLEHLKTGIRRGLAIWFLCFVTAALPGVITCPPSMQANPEPDRPCSGGDRDFNIPKDSKPAAAMETREKETC